MTAAPRSIWKTAPARRSMDGANMQHGGLVRIDAPPAIEMIEQACRGRRRRQQHRVNVVVPEHLEKEIYVLELQCAVIFHFELLAVQFGAAVDEYRHPSRDQISSERKIIEHMPGVLLLQHVDGGGRRLACGRRKLVVTVECPGGRPKNDPLRSD